MDRVELLQEAAKEYSVKFIEMISAYTKNQDSYVCIFEGEDEKYYASRLDMALNGQKWVSINAGGKKKVLELHECVVNHPIYNNFRCAFFIDADYDHWTDYSQFSNIYVTNVYSIENFYTTEETIEKLLSAEFGLSSHGGPDVAHDFSVCYNTFLKVFDEFCNIVSDFNYYAKAHRITERDNKNVKRLNLNNIKATALVKIKLMSVKEIHDRKNPHTIFKDALPVQLPKYALNEAKENLKENVWKNKFRGKQQLEFVVIWLRLLKQERNCNTLKLFKTKSVVKFQLSNENSLSELSQYASTPQCLRLFLRRFEATPGPSKLKLLINDQ